MDYDEGPEAVGEEQKPSRRPSEAPYRPLPVSPARAQELAASAYATVRNLERRPYGEWRVEAACAMSAAWEKVVQLEAREGRPVTDQEVRAMVVRHYRDFLVDGRRQGWAYMPTRAPFVFDDGLAAEYAGQLNEALSRASSQHLSDPEQELEMAAVRDMLETELPKLDREHQYIVLMVMAGETFAEMDRVLGKWSGFSRQRWIRSIRGALRHAYSVSPRRRVFRAAPGTLQPPYEPDG